jgi:transcription antitermination protein NusB
MTRRTRAREIALQVLYQLEQNPGYSSSNVDRFIERRLREPRLREFARELVAGVQAHQPRIDDLISGVAENWRLDRMAAIDRNILRLGAFEMLFCPEVPVKVAINEALELAKRYSTAQSSRFVNGILDRLQSAEPEAPEPAQSEDSELPQPDAPDPAEPEAPKPGQPGEHELVQIVESIVDDENIPKEVLFEGIKTAVATEARKQFPEATDIEVTIDPESGKIRTIKDGEEVPPEFGRIAAQTSKQLIIQKVREAMRDRAQPRPTDDESPGASGEA